MPQYGEASRRQVILNLVGRYPDLSHPSYLTKNQSPCAGKPNALRFSSFLVYSCRFKRAHLDAGCLKVVIGREKLLGFARLDNLDEGLGDVRLCVLSFAAPSAAPQEKLNAPRAAFANSEAGGKEVNDSEADSEVVLGTWHA